MSASEIRDNVQACRPLPDFTSFNPGYELHALSTPPRAPAGEGSKRGAFSRRTGARVLLQEARKPGPIRRMAAGGGTGSISIAPGSKNQEGETSTDA
jgi:hypothetical protein